VLSSHLDSDERGGGADGEEGTHVSFLSPQKKRREGFYQNCTSSLTERKQASLYID
jgi:hypothetical protein